MSKPITDTKNVVHELNIMRKKLKYQEKKNEHLLKLLDEAQVNLINLNQINLILEQHIEDTENV